MDKPKKLGGKRPNASENPATPPLDKRKFLRRGSSAGNGPPPLLRRRSSRARSSAGLPPISKELLKATRGAKIKGYGQAVVNIIKPKLKFPDDWCDYDNNNAAYRDALERYREDYVPSAGDTPPTEEEYREYRRQIEMLQTEELFGVINSRQDKSLTFQQIESDSLLNLFFVKRHVRNPELWIRDRTKLKEGSLDFKDRFENLKIEIFAAKNIEDINKIFAAKRPTDCSQTLISEILAQVMKRHPKAQKLPFTLYKWQILAELALIKRQIEILNPNSLGAKIYQGIGLKYGTLISSTRRGWAMEAQEKYNNIAQAVIEPLGNPDLACLKQLQTLRENGQLNAALIQPAMEVFHSEFLGIDFTDGSLSRTQLAALKDLDAALVKNTKREDGDKGRFGKVMFRATTGAGKTYFVEQIIIPKYGEQLDVVSIDLNSSKAEFEAIFKAIGDDAERLDVGEKYKLIVLDEATFYGKYFGSRFINNWEEGFGVFTKDRDPTELAQEIEQIEKASLKFIRDLRAKGANVLILGASESIEKVEYAECVRLDVELYQEERRAHEFEQEIAKDKDEIKKLAADLKIEGEYWQLKSDMAKVGKKVEESRSWSGNPHDREKVRQIVGKLFSGEDVVRLSKMVGTETPKVIGEIEAKLPESAKEAKEENLTRQKQQLIAKIGLAQANQFFKDNGISGEPQALPSQTDQSQSAQEISAAKIEKKRQKLEARRMALQDLKQARESAKSKFATAQFKWVAAQYNDNDLSALIAGDPDLAGIFKAEDGTTNLSNQRLQYILPDFDINETTCTQAHLETILQQTGADIIIVPHVMVGEQTSTMGCRVCYKNADGAFVHSGSISLDELDGKSETEKTLANGKKKKVPEIKSKFEEIVQELEKSGAGRPNVISFFGGPSKDGEYGGNVVGGNYKSSLGTTKQIIRIKSSRHTWADWAQWVGRNRNTDNSKFERITVIADRAADQSSFTKENLKGALDANTARHEKAHTLAHLRLKEDEPGLDVDEEDRDSEIVDKKARNQRILQDYVGSKGVGVGSLTAYIEERRAIFRGEEIGQEELGILHEEEKGGLPDLAPQHHDAGAAEDGDFSDDGWEDVGLDEEEEEEEEEEGEDLPHPRPTIEALQQRVAEYLESHNKDGKTAAEYARNYEDYLEIAVKNEADALARTVITSDILRFKSDASGMIIGGDAYPQKFNCYFLRFKNLEFNQDPVVPDAATADAPAVKAPSKSLIFDEKSGLHLPSFSNCKFSNIDFSKVENFHEWKFYGCEFDNCEFSEMTKQTQFVTIGKDEKKRECKIFEKDAADSELKDVTTTKMASFNKKPAEPAPATAQASPNPSTSISNKEGIKISMERLRDPAKAPEHAA